MNLKSLLTRKRYRKITQYKSEILEALYSVKERLENFDPQHWNLNCLRGLVLDRLKLINKIIKKVESNYYTPTI